MRRSCAHVVGLDPSCVEQKLFEVKEYLRWRRLPKHMARRIVRFHEKRVGNAAAEASFHNEQEVHRVAVLTPAPTVALAAAFLYSPALHDPPTHLRSHRC